MDNSSIGHEDSEQSLLDDLTDTLVEAATKDAFSRLPTDADDGAKQKISNAIEKRFRPHINESEIISRQISRPEYLELVAEIRDFLHAQIGITICSDGRLASLAFFAPRVAHIHRRLQGLPETRQSTKGDHKMTVVNDAMILGGIKFAIEREQKENNNPTPDIVEFLGPHIHSVNPNEGCGGAIEKVTKYGRPAKTAMNFGGIQEYFQELGSGFNAFNTIIKRVGGHGTTFDVTHDAYSQGLIFGLRDTCFKGDYEFSSDKTLREQLLDLHKDKKILMTELLGDALREEIFEEAEKHGFTETLAIRDPKILFNNLVLIERVTKNLTERHEKHEFSWLPQSVKTDISKNAVRTLAYLAIRNCVYRILGGIIPGEHDLMKHPEQLIRVGPIGAAFNVQNISFIQITPHREFRPEDVEGALALYGLLEGIAPKVGIDLTEEARIILFTEEYSKAMYRTEEIAEKELLEITSVVSNNAAKLRELLKEGVAAGETIVLGVLHESGSRRIFQVISNPSN